MPRMNPARYISLAAISCVALLLAITSSQAAGNRVEYTCNEGIPLIVKYINTSKTSIAIISHDSSPEIALDSVPAGSGAKYSDGNWVLHVKGKVALVGTGGQFDDECREVASTTAGQQQETFPIEAKSWGGIVRAGPGMKHRKLTSLSEGEWIKILERTGTMMNGYPWFKIQYRGGKVGYKWGGILCSVGTQIEGTYQTCN